MCRLKKHAYAELPPSENHASQGKNERTNTRNSAFPRALYTVCKSYQQTTKVTASKERVNRPSYSNTGLDCVWLGASVTCIL